MQDRTHDERSDMASENNRHGGVGRCCAQTKQANMAERSLVTLLDVFKDTCRDFQLICGAIFHRKSVQLHPIKWLYLKSDQDRFLELSRCFFVPQQNHEHGDVTREKQTIKPVKSVVLQKQIQSSLWADDLFRRVTSQNHLSGGVNLNQNLPSDPRLWSQ